MPITRVIFLCVFASFAFVFSSAVDSQFLVHDDFLFYNHTVSTNHSWWQYLGNGRPLSGAFYVAVKFLDPGLLGAQIARTLNVLFFAATTCLSFYFLRSAISEKWIAFIVAFVPSFLDPSLLLVAQAVGFPIGLGSFVSAGSFILHVRTVSKPTGKQLSLLSRVLPGFLLFLALNIYQPSAMFCWSIALSWLLFSNDRIHSLTERYRILRDYFLVFTATLILYFLFTKLCHAYWGIENHRSELVSSVAQIFDKIVWFTSSAIPDGLSYFWQSSRSSVGFLTCLTAVAPFVFISVNFRRLRTPGSLKLLFTVTALVLLSFLPTIVVIERLKFPYIHHSLVATLLSLLCIYPHLIFYYSKRRFLKVLTCVSIFTYAFLLVLSAQQRLHTIYIRPNVVLLEKLKLVLTAADLSRFDRVHVVGSSDLIADHSRGKLAVKIVLKQLGMGFEDRLQVTNAQSLLPPRTIHKWLFFELLKNLATDEDRSFVSSLYQETEKTMQFNMAEGLTVDQESKLELALINGNYLPGRSADRILILDLATLNDRSQPYYQF